MYHDNHLIENHMHLVRFTIQKYFYAPDQHAYEEMESLGYVGLIKAARKYQPEISKFRNFVNYAIREIWCEIAGYWRKHLRRKDKVHFHSMDKQLNEDGDTTYHDLYDDPTAVFEDKVIDETDIQQLIKRLNPMERKIITLFYGLNDSQGSYTLSEIGEILGLHISTVFKYRKEALEKLREFIGSH